MPPFLPNVRSVSRSRHSGPRSIVYRTTDKSFILSNESLKKRTFKRGFGSSTTIFDLSASTDLTQLPLQTPSGEKGFDKSDMNRQGDQRDNLRDGSSGRPHKSGRKKEQQDLDDYDPLVSGMNPLQEIPILPIYDLIMVLQQRGITVRLTSAAVREAAAQGFINRSNAVNGDRISPEIERTSRQDTHNINVALTVLLNCGADIDFGPLVREHRPSSIKCTTCGETFANQREKDEHRVRRTCEYCDDDDPYTHNCQTKFDDHIRRTHNINPHRRMPSHSGSDAGWGGGGQRN
ncbi:hypothetical protein PV08_11430 [Exophiala spinifera]|uniref:Uncharacterized protein n=1 Tax=Exophiala spinifera TaxID=91928 RepID=A0A0D1Y6G9_9EURO|nr:uncharacterized protein PV08_11430 [Exophiala spinifera]KIW10466.1 hypothetical protein PV08_11430 [Exophiala spinifera]